MAPQLSVRRSGRGRSVVLVHGFTQSARSFDDLAARLTLDYQVVAVDAPGHGASEAMRPAGMAEAAELIGDAGGEATYVGYSMGGRLCLRLALDRPDLVRALVLVSATAGIEGAAERADRRRSDLVLAERLDPAGDPLDPASAGGEEEVSPLPTAPLGLEQFLAEWLAQPLFAALEPGAEGLAARLGNTTAGLASSLRSVGTGNMEPLWSRLGELEMPVALIAGAEDAKYSALATRLGDGIGPGGELHLVPGSGHAVPWERPDDLCSILLGFLARSGG